MGLNRGKRGEIRILPLHQVQGQNDSGGGGKRDGGKDWIPVPVSSTGQASRE